MVHLWQLLLLPLIGASPVAQSQRRELRYLDNGDNRLKLPLPRFANDTTTSSTITTLSSTSSSTSPTDSSTADSSTADSSTIDSSTIDSSTSSTEGPTVLPTYDAPSGTITEGPAVTSEAAEIAPLFLYLWNNKDLIEDEDKKQEYIDDIIKTQEENKALLDSLEVKPDPEPQCDKTALKRYAISERRIRSLLAKKRQLYNRGLVDGLIGSALDSAAKLLGCADSILGNLANAVQTNPPPIPTIELLTEALNDIQNELEKEDDSNTSTDDTTTTDNTSTTQSESCTESSTVEQCTETITLSTHFTSDASTTTSSIETITTKACETETGCDVDGTTTTTTVSTATSSSASEWICGSQCAESACSAGVKRDIAPSPTEAWSATPTEIVTVIEVRTLQEFDEDLLSDAEFVNEYFIDRVDNGPDIEELDWNILNAETVSKTREFGDTAHVTHVKEIRGCTVITIASHKGIWFAHILEPGFIGANDIDNQKWERVKAALRDGDANTVAPNTLAGDGGILNPSDSKVEIFISTPQKGTRADNPRDTSQKYQDKINEIIDILTGDDTAFNGVPVTVDTYMKPVDATEYSRNLLTARFRVMIEYDPDQEVDGTSTTPSTHIRRVWNERIMHEDQWQDAPASSSSATVSSTLSTSVTSSASTTSISTTEPPTSTTETPTSTTEEPTETPTPTTPLEVGDIECHDEADFPGHADINPGAQDEFSTDFSGLEGPNGSDELSADSEPIELNIKDDDDISYQYSVSWVSGCVTTVDSQNFRFPLGLASEYTAYLMVREPFTKCKLRRLNVPRFIIYMCE